MEEQQRRREDIDYNQRFIIASPAEQEEEAEPEDQKEAIEQACMETAECKPVKNRFDSCSERVNADPETEETCVEEFFDLMHCVHNCAPEKIFHHLK